MANGDDLGFVATPKTDDLGFVPAKKAPVPQATMGPAPQRSLLQRAGDWWVRKPGTYEGVLGKESPSPRERAQSVVQGAGVASTPALVASGLEAPVATLLGLGGGTAGGYAGSKAGSYLGEKVGAPELGEDVGGILGGAAGGYAGYKAGPVVNNRLASALRYPATPAQAVLGKPGTVKNVLPPIMQKWTVPEGLIPKGEIGNPTYPMGEPSSLDEILSRRVQMAEKVKSMRPRPPLVTPPSPPNPFQGMTPSRGPLGNAPLPEPLKGSPNLFPPNVEVVPKFTPPEQPKPSRIIQPGSEASKPLHVEGSYWSFREPQLRQAVLGGDRDAAVVYRQRFGELPPGAGYLTDVGQGPLRGLYRSAKP